MLLEISQYIYTAEFNDTNIKHLLEPLGKKRRENKQKNYRKKEQIWLNAPSKTPLWINASFPLVCSSYTETPLKWSDNAFYAHVYLINANVLNIYLTLTTMYTITTWLINTVSLCSFF